ncbi:MAG: hypothetical protein JWQ09_1530 [Segetibacter sp.]|nr:hypothetical protein [Segetibacter sp.]
MKKEYFFQRQWAETVRLYSGLLESNERIKFIKSIAKEDVLLAAECRTTSILDEEELDEYLTEIALIEAKKFKASQTSAKGIMALVELNKFDEISQIFSSLKGEGSSSVHNAVVANYIANGSELQISTFLIVLAEANKELLDRAVDKVFDLNIFFSPYSITQIQTLVDNFLSRNEVLLAAKLICAVSIKKKIFDDQKLLDALLKNRQIKYAEKLVTLYRVSPVVDIYHYLSDFLKQNLPRDLLVRFLELCKKAKLKYDLSTVRIELSKHLNPRIKSLTFDYRPEIPLSQELIYKIYLENIKIANHSSMEFAMNLVNKYGLQDKVSIDFIIENLLNKPQFQRLELAYKLIKENNISNKYPYELIFDLALNKGNIQTYNLARQIIIEEFNKNQVFDALMYLCCVMIVEQNAYKVAREIILKDLQSINETGDLKEGSLYYGYVTNYFKKLYQIDCGFGGLQINVPKENVGRLRLHDFIQFKLIAKNDKISDSIIKVVNKNIIEGLYSKYYFGALYYGQIIELKVQSFDNYNIYLIHPDYLELTFIVNIKEIAKTYVRKISDYVAINEFVMAKIIEFNRVNKKVFCSIKEFSFKNRNEESSDSTDKLNEKIALLQSRFKNS